MKINNINQNMELHNYLAPKGPQEAGKKPETPAQDLVEISQTTQDLRVAKDKCAEVPEVREDRVADVKERLGNYQVDLDLLADNLLQEIDESRTQKR